MSEPNTSNNEIIQTKLISLDNITTLVNQLRSGFNPKTKQGQEERNLGSSSNKWDNIYANNINGVSTEAEALVYYDNTRGEYVDYSVGGAQQNVYFENGVPVVGSSFPVVYIDSNGNEPEPSQNGDFWIDTSTNTINIKVNNSWVTIFSLLNIPNNSIAQSKITGLNESLASKQPMTTTISITLDKDEWDTTNKTQEISNIAIHATSDLIVSPVAASIINYSDAMVYCSSQAEGTVVFTCEYLPADDITVNILIIDHPSN